MLKLSSVIIAAAICFANTGFAQTDTLYSGPASIHFQALFEPQVGFGEFYEDIAEYPFRLGLRTGIYGSVSKTVALGLGLQGSTIIESLDPVGSICVGGGPDLLVVGKRHGKHSVFYFKTFFHVIHNSAPSSGRNRTGVELGTHIGGMRRFGGFMYGFGMAYDLIPRYPDGFKILANIGFGTPIDLRPTTAISSRGKLERHERHEYAVIMHVIAEFAYGGGGLYETVTDNRFQYGVRTVLYGFVSSVTAIGISGHIAASASVRHSVGYGVGPAIIIASRSNRTSYGWQTRLYAEVMSQSWKKTPISRISRSGGEFGISLGRGKRRGFIFEIGTAFEMISGIDNGYRIFTDIGYAF